MKAIQLQVSVTLEDEAANTVVDLIRRAITTEIDTPRGGVSNAPRHALFAGQKPPEDRGLLIDTNQVAHLLKVCQKTVWTMHTQGRMPQSIRIGSAVRWGYEEIRQWVEAGCPQRDEWERQWQR